MMMHGESEMYLSLMRSIGWVDAWRAWVLGYNHLGTSIPTWELG